MFNPGTFAMDDGGRCLLDVINDPLLLQSFLEDKDEESAKEFGHSLSSVALENALLGQQDQVSSTTTGLVPRQSPDSMGYGCSGADKPVAAALAATSSAPDVVSAAPSPHQLLVSSTVPPPCSAASNGLPGATPHSTRSSPATSRPHSASPRPAPASSSASSASWSSSSSAAGPSPARSQSLPSASSATPTTKATATVAPLPAAPQQAPPSRPSVVQVVSANPTSRTSGAPRLIQPKQPQLLPKLSSGSGSMASPAATGGGSSRSQSPRAAPHKATPQPSPVPPQQPAATVQRGAAMGLNTGSPLLIGNPAGQPGMFPTGPAQGTFLLNQYIPGLGQSPILIQGSLGQIQGSLGQIQGVQLALRPPQAGLTLGHHQAPKHHGGHPGHPTLVIPGPRPNIILAPRMVSSPLSFAIAPGQPLTLQQLQAMLPPQTMLAQPTLGAFQTDQHHQPLMQIPTFTQPQILTHDHHHHHHHHHGALSGPLISATGTVVSSAGGNLVTHHPVMTTNTTVLHPVPMQQPMAVPATTPMTSATVLHQPQPATTSAPAPVEKPVRAPTVNLAELLKEHGIMPESTPPPSPTSNQEGTISVEVPVTPAPVTENVQVVVSKSPQTVAVSPQQRVQLSLAHDGSVVLHPSGGMSVPAPVQSPGLTVTPTSTSASGATALSRTHSALLERLSAAPPVSVPDLASLTAPRVTVTAPTVVAPSLVAPSVVTHPHQLTLHTVNNGLVSAQQLGQQSFVTLHGSAVANMLCHGANNARINHIVVSPSPMGHHQHQQQQQQQHHQQQTLHHTCHAVVSSVASSVVPTTTTATAVMAPMGRTAVPHTVVSVAASPVVTTVTPMVTVTASNSSSVAPHSSGHSAKCTAPMNSQNQQLYEQLQTQITYLNSLKKPTPQQKLLLQQMISIEEKLRESNKPQVSSSSNDNTATVAPLPHPHSMQRHEPPAKQVVVSQPISVAATIITAKPSVVTSVQVPTVSVATTTRTTSRSSHHKANHHGDVKPKASILHHGNAASIVATPKISASHSAPPSQAASKFVPQQLLHPVHHLHHHHHHHPVGAGVSPVNQRSPPQPRQQPPVVVRLQHPSNHIISPTPTKQILVQVPSIINKPPSKSSSSSGGHSSKSAAPSLPCKAEPIPPKPCLPPPEQPPKPPPAPPPPPPPPLPPPPAPKPVVVKPKVPDRVQKMHMFHQRVSEDQNGATAPDCKSAFTSRHDACQRLLRYHVYNSRLPREEDLQKTDELFSDVSERLLEEQKKLYQKYHYLMLLEGMRQCSTAEQIMVQKLFLEHETEALAEEKRMVEERQYASPEPLQLPPVPENAWAFESTPAPLGNRPVKKEPPDSWLDDRADLEPAAKRRSIKEEHETDTSMEETLEDDLGFGIRKDLGASPPPENLGEDDDEFAHADFELPVPRFLAGSELKRTHPRFDGVAAPPVVPDWTCSKSADPEPRAPELDLSGIEGLDDDSSGADALGRTHYFGDDDDEEDKDSVELHDQVQSAINSILDFRRGGADDGLCADSKGGLRGGPEPMDFDDATGDAQPDSVLDEAVRSILL